MSAKFLVLVYLVAVMFPASALTGQTKSLQGTHQGGEATKLRFNSCWQSSDYSDDSNCELAMDGQYNHCSSKNCSQTKRETHSLWNGRFKHYVKLGKVRIVGEMQDTFWNHLNNFKIIIDTGVCAEYKSHSRFFDGTFDCKGMTRTIKIKSSGTNYLSLCEVIPIEDDTTTSNFKACEQSSQSGDHKCSYAMDGKHDVSDNKQSTLTKSTDRSWWKGILRAKLNIRKVRVVSPLSHKLSNFRILLDDDKVCANHDSQEVVRDKVFECEGYSRTVTIQLIDKGILSLCEVMVIELERQPERFVRCEQTSRDGDGYCTKAMDGLHNFCGAQETTSQPEEIKNNAWTGFFESERLIKQVRVVGRNFNNGLRNFKIVLDGNKVCYEHNSKNEVQDETFDCEGKTRSVRVELMLVGNPSLCEVIAYKNQLKPGWILIQQRETPGLDFNRSWNDYKNGFKYSQKDFWLGLQKIYHITKNGGYGLRLEFETHKNLSRFAEWKDFRIENEAKKYAMHISGFDNSSSVGSDHEYMISFHNGSEFVTEDRDNSASCARKLGGGWWMRADAGEYCVFVHFNNDLRSRIGHSLSCVHYYYFTGYTYNYECLRKVRMILIKH